MTLRFAIFVAAALVLLPAAARADSALGARRIAVVVGANAAPAGRRELRFALDDAQRMADTLRRVGRFAPSDVHVLLEPNPQALLQVLDRVAAQAESAPDTLLVFYYSGHSDGLALFPHGETLQLSDLRDHLTRIRARVRVGILDTCRGGSWTQAKDLSLAPPLPAADLVPLSSEGTVLVAASSGFENAHEAEAVRGSFFTHHLTVGLLGAADRGGDGKVTIQEAFEYARERTVRDSARYAPVPQHPSFEIDLRGRQDVVLAQINVSGSVLELVQTEGPLEIIELASGTTVAELPMGARRSRLALLPGRYLIRRLSKGDIYSKEAVVPSAGRLEFSEAQLERADPTALAMKGGDALPEPRSQASTSSAGWFQLSVAAGVTTGTGSAGTLQYSHPLGSLERSFALQASLTYALTDRFSWVLPFPAFSYRFGDAGHFEVIPRLGLVGAGHSSSSGLLGIADGGLSFRFWTDLGQSVIGALVASDSFAIATNDDHAPGGVRSWEATATAGYGFTIRNVVSLYPGLGVKRAVGFGTEQRPGEVTVLLGFGSVLMLGYRSLPLVQLHLTPELSLDAHALWAVVPETGAWYDKYLAGFTWDF